MKRTPLRRSPMKPSQSRLKRSAGIRKQSRKRAAVSGDERQLYADVVAEAGRCERCETLPAIEAHHLMRRSSGKKRLERENLVGLCRPCHDFIHRNPKWAYENDWLRSKFNGR